MRLAKNKIVVASYSRGILIKEQELSNESELANVVERMFGSAQPKEEGQCFDVQVQNLRNAAEQRQKM